MVGFGLGFGSRSASRHNSPLGPNVPISTLSPSALWNGTAGSGFAGAPPSDPVRTTAKPVCRLLVPPNQHFTDELVIGVWAGANDQGTMLDNLGLERVVAHCEGQSLVIEAPSFCRFEDARGNHVRYFGWWAVLQHPGSHGHAQIYFEAVPKDPAMQSRVIGPYQFSPQPVLHDLELEVAATPVEIPGTRYRNVSAALNYLAAMSAQNPLITIIEGFTGDLASANFHAGRSGYTTITATAPVVFRKPGLLPGAASLFRPQVDGLWFRGPNITFDFHNAAEIYHENPANRAHVFDGVRIVDSGGRYYLPNLGQKSTSCVARDAPWLLECHIDAVQNAANGAALVRGCLLENGNSDAASGASCVIGSTIRNWTSGEWRTEIPAMTVHYTGAGASATLDLAGANETTQRVFTARVEGSIVGTFAVRNSEADFIANTNYTVAHLVEWLNGLPGWNATLLDNTRRATALSRTARAGGPFEATDVKSAPLSLVTMFDQQAELWAWAGSPENVIFNDNLCYNNSARNISFAPPAGIRDAMVLNNVFDLDETDPDFGSFLSELSAAHSHVVIAHNSISNQEMVLRRDTTYDPDGYCLLANNVAASIRWLAGSPDSDLEFSHNHLQAGSSVPAGSSGTTFGGNRTTLFVDAGSGDFTPQGPLLDNLKTPVIPYDRVGAARGVPAMLGALGGPGAVAPAITSVNPSGTYPENQSIGGTLSANKTVTWSVEGPDAGGVLIDPMTGRWSLAQSDFETKAAYAFSFVGTDHISDTATQIVAIALSDLDEIAPVLSHPLASANGTSGAMLSIDTSEGNGTLYCFVSNSPTPPSAAALIAGIGAVAGRAQAVNSAGTCTASVSGLAANMAYFAYYLHRNAAGNSSGIAQSGGFTTAAASGGSVAVISSAAVIRSTDSAASYTAGTPFAFVGGAGRMLVAVVTLSQQAAQSANDVTLSVDQTTMTRVSGAAHSVGASRPICAVFVATGLDAGSKTITVTVAGSARSCSVLAMEVAGLNPASLLANTASLEGNSLTYSHSYTPTATGNLVLSVLATRQGERGPFVPDDNMTELLDDSTGATATSDHSVFVGYTIAPGTAATNVGATTSGSTDALFLVTELQRG